MPQVNDLRHLPFRLGCGQWSRDWSRELSRGRNTGRPGP
jgi:hypothetical protein